MKPLCDEDRSRLPPNEIELASLLAEAPRLGDTTLRERRIWAALESRRQPERRTVTWLRPVGAVVALVLAGTLVVGAARGQLGAWLGWSRRVPPTVPVPDGESLTVRVPGRGSPQSWEGRTPPDSPGDPPLEPTASLPPTPSRSPISGSSVAVSSPVAPLSAVAQPSPSAPFPAGAAPSSRVGPRQSATLPARHGTSAESPSSWVDRSSQPREEEALTVLEATRLLKRERRAADALKVLDGYFRRFPEGVMQEEALALSIEAAAGAGDSRRSQLARRYLARFPQGRFRDLAQNHLGPP